MYSTPIKTIELDNGARYTLMLIEGVATWCNYSGTFCNERQLKEIMALDFRVIELH